MTDVNIGFLGTGLVTADYIDEVVGDFLESQAEDALLRFVVQVTDDGYTDTVADLVGFAAEQGGAVLVEAVTEAGAKSAASHKKALSVASKTHAVTEPNAGLVRVLREFSGHNYLFVLFDDDYDGVLDDLIVDSYEAGVRVFNLTDGLIEIEIGEVDDNLDGDAPLSDPDPEPDIKDAELVQAYKETEPEAIEAEIQAINAEIADDYTNRETLVKLSRTELKEIGTEYGMESFPRSTDALIDQIVELATNYDLLLASAEEVVTPLPETTVDPDDLVVEDAADEGLVYAGDNIVPLDVDLAIKRANRSGRGVEEITADLHAVIDELISALRSEGKPYTTINLLTGTTPTTYNLTTQ